MSVVLIFFGIIAGLVGLLFSNGATVGAGLVVGGAVLFGSGCIVIAIDAQGKQVIERLKKLEAAQSKRTSPEAAPTTPSTTYRIPGI